MVSIVLPTYNRKHILGEAIDSVLAQSYIDWELVIVDDCSSDGTEEFLLDHYGERMQQEEIKGRIRYYRNEKNLGAAGSRNRGIEQAAGEMVAFIDSDTTWIKEKLSLQMELFEQHPDAGMIYSPFIKSAEGQEVLFPPSHITKNCLNGNIFYPLLQMPLVDTPTMLIPTWILQEMGGFNEELRCLEDYELSLRIAKNFELYMYEKPTIVSYLQDGCVSMNIDGAFESRFYMLREFRSEYEKYGLFEKKLQELMQMAIDGKRETLYMQLMQKYLL